MQLPHARPMAHNALHSPSLYEQHSMCCLGNGLKNICTTKWSR